MAHDAIQRRRNFDLLQIELRRIGLQHRGHDFDRVSPAKARLPQSIS